MNNSNKTFFIVQIISDFLVVIISIFMAYYLTSGYGGFERYSYEEVTLIAIVFSLVIFSIYKPYECGEKKYVESLFNVIISIVFIHIMIVFIGYIFKESKIPNDILMTSLMFNFILFIFEKAIFYNIYLKIHRIEKVVVIGTEKDKERITSKLITHLNHVYEVKYIINSDRMEFDEIKTYIEEMDVIFGSENLQNQTKDKILKFCYEISKEAYIIPDKASILRHSAKFTNLDDIPLFGINNKIFVEQLILKRLIDIFLAIIGIILTLPLMIIAFIGIKIQDGGPVLFRQKRLTIDSREFEMIKFRTMIVDAEKTSGPVLADDNDLRITPFGQFLRASRIDEIPQLFNVLEGSMSIVGPRPERREIVDIYLDGEEEYLFYRNKVKAGITGLAQVFGKYNTGFRDKLIFDLFYINNYSLMLDMKILFYTLKVIFIKNSSEGIKDEESFKDVLKSSNYDILKENDGVIWVRKVY